MTHKNLASTNFFTFSLLQFNIVCTKGYSQDRTRNVYQKSCLFSTSQCKYIARHGLINFIDIKAKCCHLKKLPCKGTLQQVFIRVYTLEILSAILPYWYFRPSFVNCCPLPFSLVYLSPPPFLVYSVQRGGGGYGVLGLTQISTCLNVPYRLFF
jgi:hypothetical protein